MKIRRIIFSVLMVMMMIISSIGMEEAEKAGAESIKQDGILDGKMYLSINYASLEKGSDIRVDLYINQLSSTSFSGFVTYDTDSFEYVKMEISDDYNNAGLGDWELTYDGTGTRRFLITESNVETVAFGADVRLASLYLKAKKDINSEKVTLSNMGAYDIESDKEYFDTKSYSWKIMNTDLLIADYPYIYQDYTHTTPVTDNTITNYVGGKTVTTNGTKKNYKSTTVYTDILGSYKYTTNAKGKLVTSTGKVIAGVTSSTTKPTLVKGKIVDKEAANIAKASIKNGQITVTAGKQAGTVYLWVIDTGDVGTSAYCPITVKATPSTIGTYAISPESTAFSYDTTKKYTRGDINVSDSTKIYVYPSCKTNNTVTKVSDVTFSATVDSKVSDYFTVAQDSDDPYCFLVTAKGLKDGKKVSGKITIQCNENGKKATFTATACNSVTGITVENLSNLTAETDSTHLSIGTSATEKTIGTLTLTPSCAVSSQTTTDDVKIYAMGSEDGFDAQKMTEGSVKITKTASKEQKKVSASMGSDKKTLTVTSAKGATAGVTSYFLIVYNTVKDGDKCGYQVISVTTK